MAANPDSTDLAQLNRGRIEDPAKREMHHTKLSIATTVARLPAVGGINNIIYFVHKLFAR
jgi:hypothetical protein